MQNLLYKGYIMLHNVTHIKYIVSRGLFSQRMIEKCRNKKGVNNFNEAYKIAKKRFGAGYCQHILKFENNELVGFFWLDWYLQFLASDLHQY